MFTSPLFYFNERGEERIVFLIHLGIFVFCLKSFSSSIINEEGVIMQGVYLINILMEEVVDEINMG